MPRGDGTGPWGMGPMTGRAAGFCAGFNVPGYANPIPGRAFGVGLGRGWFGGGGRGWRHWYYATGLPGWMRAGYAPAWGAPAPSPEQETAALRQQAEALKAALDQINQRLEQLSKEQE